MRSGSALEKPRRRRRRAIRCAASLLSTVLLATSAGANPAAPAPTLEREWEAVIFGYGWLSSVEATLSVGPATVEMDERIGDLLPLLTWAVAGGAEARYGRIVFGIDALGQQLQTTVRAPATTFPLDPLGGAFQGLTASRNASSASIRTTEVMAEAVAGWRAVSMPVSRLFPSAPATDPRRIRIDLLGGARYWYWRTEVRLDVAPVVIQSTNPPPLPSGLQGRLADRILDGLDLSASIQVGGSDAVLSDETSWTDAIVGLRVGGDVLDDLALTLRADVGGFGFGDSSTFSWQVMPGIQWRFAESWVAAANWRAIGFSHGAVEDAILYGALAGIGYRF